MSDFEAVKADTRNGRRIIREHICFSEELTAEYHEKLVAYSDAVDREKNRDPETPSKTRASAQPETVTTRQAIVDLVEGNPTSFHEVGLQAMIADDWNALRAKYPPRDGVEADGGKYNVDKFAMPAIAAALVDPEPTDSNVEFIRVTLTNGERERLLHLIWNLNEGVRPAPKVGQILSILGGSESE